MPVRNGSWIDKATPDQLRQAVRVMARGLRVVEQGHPYQETCGCARCHPLREAIRVAQDGPETESGGQ